jgi:hypothetical protein
MTDETASDRTRDAAAGRTGLYLGAILVEAVAILALWLFGLAFGP